MEAFRVKTWILVVHINLFIERRKRKKQTSLTNPRERRKHEGSKVSIKCASMKWKIRFLRNAKFEIPKFGQIRSNNV